MAMRSSASGAGGRARRAIRRGGEQPRLRRGEPPATASAVAAASPCTPPMSGRAIQTEATPAENDATRMAQNDAAGMVTPERESMSRVASATSPLMGT